MASQGRHLTGKQILAFARAVANQPKGTIYIESLGLFPRAIAPSSPSGQLPNPESQFLKPFVASLNEHPMTIDSGFDEAEAFTLQLWKVLQQCEYNPAIRDGSHDIPDQGISIRLFHLKAMPIAVSLRDALSASNVRDVRIGKITQDDPYLPSTVLMEISIGAQ